MQTYRVAHLPHATKEEQALARILYELSCRLEDKRRAETHEAIARLEAGVVAADLRRAFERGRT
jgi:hypothetical protein